MKRHVLATALMSGWMGLSGLAHADGQAKNVIFFLGDGMGPATVTATRIYKVGEGGRLTFETLGRTARIKTYSNDAQTTDSAPSMAAYMTGVKMNNEVLSMSTNTKAVAPSTDSHGNLTINNCASTNGTPVATLLELAKKAGKGTGSVTTTELTHATPAATYSHICHRNAQYNIAAQATPGSGEYNAALADGVDVLMGGGRNQWLPYSAANPTGRADGQDLLALMRKAGYSVAATKAEMSGVTKGKLLGLYSSKSHLEYDLDRLAGKGEGATQPSLSEMTSKAIDLLAQNPNGYFLMVEGGRIDHALHGTNAKRVVTDASAFDDAIKTALSKVNLNDTLIVVTADHDHTMTINGYGKRGNPILDINRSYADGLPSKDATGKTYTTLVFGNGPNRKAVRTDVESAAAMADDYQQETGVRLASETHGGGDVMLFADGPDAKLFKGTLDNTKVFGLVRRALGF